MQKEPGRPESIWKEIRVLRGEGKVLSLSSSRYDNESKGMVKFHGYAFLSTYENEKEGLRLVKVGLLGSNFRLYLLLHLFIHAIYPLIFLYIHLPFSLSPSLPR